MKIQEGNFDIECKNHKDWIFGHFMEDDSPFKNEDFEIKWGNRLKGFKAEEKNSIAEDGKCTLAILVHGKIIMTLSSLNKIVELSKQGDYFYYEPAMPHSVEALEDSLILTIRWNKK